MADLHAADKPLLQAFCGGALSRPPFWLMRQAGRYLPEYRALRARQPDFLRFCYTPELTVEAALQPLRRYRMDAAILFSDILVVPDALGQPVSFVEGQGPVLEPVRTREGIARLRPGRVIEHLQPVFRSIRDLKAALPADVALIGFAGAPWTVALYMVEGRGGGGEGATARRWALAEPEGFAALIETLTEATIAYLTAQLEAGAEVLQLFDSWAGLLPESEFHRWVIEPTARIVDRVRTRAPDVPVIGFPRGAGALYVTYAARTGVDGVGVDASVPLDWAKQVLQPETLVQGNLDNQTLVVGGNALERELDRVHRTLRDGRWIFNLGHGVLPDTPPETVARLAEIAHGWTVGHEGAAR